MEVLINYIEHLVEEQLGEYLNKREDLCKCEKCQLDMKAYTLNKLKPQYIVTDKGYVYQKIEEMRLQYNIDILKTIVEAANVVKKNPRHK